MKPAPAQRTVPDRLLCKTANAVEQRLAAHGVELTLGGEPTYVPEHPEGAEWHYAAVGPTKLGFARKFAAALVARHLPGAAVVLAPGKQYPGETNPRWSLQILARRDGKRVVSAPPKHPRPLTLSAMAQLRTALARQLNVAVGCWHKALDPRRPGEPAWVLPLDYDLAARSWRSQRWRLGEHKGPMQLLDTDGPAGLRLPLSRLPKGSILRALTLSRSESGRLEAFLPPVVDRPYSKLLNLIDRQVRQLKLNTPDLAGYVPHDSASRWIRLGMTADPGVIEVNLPPCSSWQEYAAWLDKLEDSAACAGLRSWKYLWTGQPVGTGGGNHILFGGPHPDRNPFFSRPWWLARIIRYWQAHPALSYLFSGIYVGASSQAPRPDESSRDLTDLEMAYAFLESLGANADRSLINETIRHMHIDASGNTHRTEISVDKFWTPGTSAGCSGLIEFRAVETLPKAVWMSAVALLWRALAAMLIENKPPRPLTRHGRNLHDQFFLPYFLTRDLDEVLDDLGRAGLALPAGIFQEITDWRLPLLYAWQGASRAMLEVRSALEGWPLLCEVPTDGGATSRFVDTSIERIELRANKAFTSRYHILLGGADIRLKPVADGETLLAGVRFRRSALYPCLHPGLPPDMPLKLDIIEKATGRRVHAAIMPADALLFRTLPVTADTPCPMHKLPALPRNAWTHDLRTVSPMARRRSL